MALKLTVDSLDSVPEALHGEYEEHDGKFRLKVDGLEDTSGLKSALDKERKAAKDLAAKMKRWESLGKSDEEIAELIAAQEKAAEEDAKKKGDFDALRKQDRDKYEKEKADLSKELDAARASERGAIIENKLTTALVKAGATEEGIDLLPDRLAARIDIKTVDGKRSIRITQADGETPLAGSGQDGLATFDDLVKEAVNKWPSLFKGSGAGGSGKQPGSDARGSGGKTITRKDFDALSSSERTAKMREGFRVVD